MYPEISGSVFRQSNIQLRENVMAKKVLVNLDMNKNEIQNVVMQSLATAPTSPKEGQYYYNSADGKAYQYVRTSASGVTPATYAWKTLGGAEITVDSAMSDSSTNPVQNKVVKKAIGDAIAALPKEQFLDLTKTTFVQSFVWSSTSYPGSTNPSLEGKPVLVLALKNSSNNTVVYSFLNMYELVDTYTADSPIKVTGRKITHMNSTVEPGDKAIDNEVNPSFGSSFVVPGFTVDPKGHLSNVALNMITIPDTMAQASANGGLMSHDQSEKLNAMPIIRQDWFTLSAGSTTAKKTLTPTPSKIISVQATAISTSHSLNHHTPVVVDWEYVEDDGDLTVSIASAYSNDIEISILYSR